MLTVLLSSPRVAPGLLSWQAWSALHAAGRVLAGSAGHPLIPALAAAGVVTDMVDGPSSADGAALAAFLSSTVSASRSARCCMPRSWRSRATMVGF